MNFTKESIFISGIRSFINTLLGTAGIFIALMACIMIFAIFLGNEQKDALKNKVEILPDLNGETKILSLKTPVVLQLDIHDIIGKSFTYEDIYYQLIESRKSFLKNNRVKAILLHVNSPGGDAVDSDDIYKALKKYKEKYNIPIYAYIDGLCASGGFYISCAADKIYSSSNSIIGSVGSRIGPFFNFSKILENWGINSSTITDGKNKDMMNPFRPWVKDEDESLKEINEYIYNNFVDIVAKARNINKDLIIKEYGAKIFSSKKAKEIGYIDETDSSYEIVMTDLLNAAKIDLSKEYQVVTLKTKKTWFQPLVTQTKCLIESIFSKFFLSSKSLNNIQSKNIELR
ncbi:MAG: S49 family peptidase [Parachlamydiales bacterium]|jgi:signal peptide peptidase SppA